jgi:hypothetical protein
MCAISPQLTLVWNLWQLKQRFEARRCGIMGSLVMEIFSVIWRLKVIIMIKKCSKILQCQNIIYSVMEWLSFTCPFSDFLFSIMWIFSMIIHFLRIKNVCKMRIFSYPLMFIFLINYFFDVYTSWLYFNLLEIEHEHSLRQNLPSNVNRIWK